MLARAPEPHDLAHATALPFPDERFGSVALLYVLYHLLRHGGLVAVAAPSRGSGTETIDRRPAPAERAAPCRPTAGLALAPARAR
jgi:hypothetical protein